jgi:putative CocE/NonD family hydrolase
MPLFALVALVVSPFASHSDFRVFFNGSPAGFSKWDESSDGAFSSSTEISLGGLKITSNMTGHFQDEKLSDSEVHDQGPGGATTLTYKGGVVSRTAGGQTKATPYAPKQFIYGASLYPALWSSAAKHAYSEMQGSPEGTTKSLQVFLIDSGAELPCTFKLLAPKQIRKNGEIVSASRLLVTVAGVQFELDTDKDQNAVAMDVPGQKIRFIEAGWDALYTDPLAAYPELSQPTFKTKFVSNTRVPMRDGVTLSTDLTMPDAAGKYPAILIRTPYGRGSEDTEGAFYARRGYVVVSQDCRGKGDSDGAWDPFVNEGNDGYDTIQWIAKQPWSTGKVGMIGGSYVGYVQWAAAVKRPPALKCIVPQVSPPDAMHNLPYDFGIPFLYGDIWWSKIVAGKGMDTSSFQAPLPNPQGIAALPLEDVDKATLGQTIPFYQSWLKRTKESDWKGWDFLSHMRDANVPALHISGWWDGDGIGTKLNWAAERELGRKDQWLIFGPWPHAFNSTTMIGKVDYGPTAVLELDSLYLRWFDTWLKDKQVGLEKVPHVRAFVTGANKWVDLGDWPDKTEMTETLFLSQRSGEQIHAGPVSKGILTNSPTPGGISYSYDPAKDTNVEALSNGAASEEATFDGIAKYGDSKQPVVLFESHPLSRDTAIAGPATVDLYFKSSAQDTDLYASIVDIDEQGQAHVMGAAGKIRASYRFGMNRIEPLHPNEVNHVQILPWEFAHEVKMGHRIGLLIMASGFPGYARNLGTIGPVATNKTMAVQNNTFLFGPDTPSRVQFHVLWAK